MNIVNKTIPHIFRNKYLLHTGNTTVKTTTSGGGTTVIDTASKWFYEDEDGNLHTSYNFIGDKEVSAYGAGNDSSAGGVTIYDGLDSTAIDVALSANLGKVLKDLIDNAGTGGVSSWNDLTDKPDTFTPSAHTHNYTSTVKVGTTSYSVTDNIVSLPAYPVVPVNYTADECTTYTTDEGTCTPAAVKKAVETFTHTHSNKSVLDTITSTKTSNWDAAYTAKHSHSNKTVLDGIKATDITNWNNKLDKSVWDSAFYFDSDNNLKVKVNLIGEKEVSAYGAGTTSGGVITIVDNLTSISTDAALSANLGRVLKELIDNIEVGATSWNLLTDKPTTFTPSSHTHTIANVTGLLTALDGKAASDHTHSYLPLSGGTLTGMLTIVSPLRIQHSVDTSSARGISWKDTSNNTLASITNHNTAKRLILNATGAADTYSNTEGKYSLVIGNDELTYNTKTIWHSGNLTPHTHSNKTVIDKITQTNLDNWSTAYTNNHTHSNKSVLDGITSTKVSNWDGVVTNWNKAFYFDTNGNLRAKLNLIGEKEISAFGAGTSSGSGLVTIVDNLTSTSTDAALSANLGRVLKNLIDNFEGGVTSWNLLTDKPSWIGSTKPTYTASEVGAAAASHNHSAANITSGTLAVARGGTGQTTLNTACNSFLNALTEGTSNPVDTDYYIALYAGGGTTTTTYHRRPVSALYNYMKGKFDGVYSALGHTHNYAASSHTHTFNNINNATDIKLTVGTPLRKVVMATNHYTSAGVHLGYVSRVALGLTAPNLAFSSAMLSVGTNDGGTAFTDYYFSTSGSITDSKGNTYAKISDIPTSIAWTNVSGRPTVYKAAECTSYTDDSNVCTIAAVKKAIGLFQPASHTHSYLPLAGGTLTGDLSLNSNVLLRTSRADNPLLKLVLNNVNWYVQAYLGYLYLGSGSANSVRIDSTGNLLSPKEITSYSDARLKSDIKPLTNRGIITPVTYKKDGKDSIGFIAQEVREKYPELVTEDNSEDKYLSLNYSQYTAVLQAQIIELKNLVDELKSELKELRK